MGLGPLRLRGENRGNRGKGENAEKSTAPVSAGQGSRQLHVALLLLGPPVHTVALSALPAMLRNTLEGFRKASEASAR